MKHQMRQEFFDRIAEQWDSWEDAEAHHRLEAGLEGFQIQPDETVVDLGCGTGNLTAILLGHLSPVGRVIGVDASPGMLAVARRKITDTRVSWLLQDATHTTLSNGCCDRVIGHGLWPHLDDLSQAAREIWRILQPGGSLHVWHSIPRVRVNEIHASADPSVCHDLLQPASHTAALLTDCGFLIAEHVDDVNRYLVSATKPGP